MAKKAAGATKNTSKTSSTVPVEEPAAPIKSLAETRQTSSPSIWSVIGPFLVNNAVYLVIMMVPFVTMLLTNEAPPRPFSVLRDAKNPSVRTQIIPNILLVTAHPDDEVLFAPTILSLLTEEKRGNATLYALCLSSGDYAGGSDLVETRKAEWTKSWDILGLEEERRIILDVPKLRDNVATSWDPSAIADQVAPIVLKYEIDTILTFDEGGITQHPQHASLPAGITHMLTSSSFTKKIKKGKIMPRLFTLKTFSSPLSHFGPLSGIIEHLKIGYKALVVDHNSRVEETTKGEAPTIVLNTIFVSDVRRYIEAFKALLQHKSQLGVDVIRNAIGGKYLWVNEWVEVVPA